MQPLLVGVRGLELAQIVQSVGEAGQHDAAGDVGELAALRDHAVVVVLRAQLTEHFLAIFLQRADRKPVGHDDEVGRCANCGQRRNPPALALAHQADRHTRRVQQLACVRDGSKRVVGKLAEVDSEAAVRSTGAALVVDEHRDAVGRQQVLQIVERDCAVLTGAEDEDHESLRLGGREQLAVQRVADAGESAWRSGDRDALRDARRSALQTKLQRWPGQLVEDRFGDARLARRPTGPAVKMAWSSSG